MKKLEHCKYLISINNNFTRGQSLEEIPFILSKIDKSEINQDTFEEIQNILRECIKINIENRNYAATHPVVPIFAHLIGPCTEKEAWDIQMKKLCKEYSVDIN